MYEPKKTSPGTFSPTHPGQVLRKMYLERLGLSVSTAAAAVGISRTNFSQFLNGRFSLTPEMAVRISRAFDTPPELWLMLQMEYDLRRAEERLRDTDIVRLVPSRADEDEQKQDP